MISIRELSLSFGGKVVLDSFSLELPGTGVSCLMGPSGCGKTTLLRVLAGLARPSRGSVSGLPERPALLFQEDRLLPWCTALENVVAVLPGEERDRAKKLLAAVELEREADSLPEKLSGGMRRRVALARCLAFGGGIMLLDEPFKGMDAALSERLARVIADAGAPVIAVTHSLEEARLLGGAVTELAGPPLRVI